MNRRVLEAVAIADMTHHSPAATARPRRLETRAIVLHRIGGAPSRGLGDSAEDVARFFLSDPEGVATVTLDGTEAERSRVIQSWRASGVPPEARARAFVPYTFLIAPDGAVSQWLPLDARGAHAAGHNDSSVGVAFIGDLRARAPSPEQWRAGLALCALLVGRYGRSLTVLGHDEVRAAPKQCPGAGFALTRFRDELSARLDPDTGGP